MAEHTPGPWNLDYTSIDMDRKGYISVDSLHHSALADVVWRMEDEERSPQCEANARLIAAAPALYDALRRLLVTNRGNADEHEPNCRCCVHEAEAAIALVSSSGSAANQE